MAGGYVGARFSDTQLTPVADGGNMNTRNAIRATLATITVAAAVLLTACEDLGSPGRAASPAASAHDPSLHGRGSPAVVAAVPDYATLENAGVSAVGGALKLEADAAGDIPRFADTYIGGVAVFGYAWADLETGRGIVAVIHPAIGRDSNQNPDAWHTHPVQLAAGAGASNFCIVTIGTSQAGIAIVGSEIRVNISENQADLSADDMDVAAAFFVQPEAGCAATGLGVKVLSAVNL